MHTHQVNHSPKWNKHSGGRTPTRNVLQREQTLKAKRVRRNQLLDVCPYDEAPSEREYSKSNKFNPCDSVLRDLDANHINRLSDTQYDIGNLTV